MFTPAIFDAARSIELSGRGELEITDAIQALVDRGLRVDPHIVHGWWKDTGQVQDMLEANRLILDDLSLRMDGELVDSRVEGRVAVEEGALLERTTVRGPAIIGRGARLTDAYIGPYTAIGDSVSIEKAEPRALDRAFGLVDLGPRAPHRGEPDRARRAHRPRPALPRAYRRRRQRRRPDPLGDRQPLGASWRCPDSTGWVAGQARTAERIIGRVASQAHGVATRSELIEAGLSKDEIDWRLGTGALIRIHRGVYRVGHTAPSLEASYLAAVRACGDGALLYGPAAAFLRGLLRGPAETPRAHPPPSGARRGHPPRPARRRARSKHPPRDPHHHCARTLVDLAAVFSEDEPRPRPLHRPASGTE